MSIESLSAETLLTALSTAFAATYPIAMPLSNFKPPAVAETYLDVSWLPNGAAFESVGNNVTHQGLMQVSVMHPLKSTLIVHGPLAIAGAVADAFDGGSRFFGTGCSVKITTRPVITQPIPDDGYVRVPVTISYQGELT